MTRQLMKGNEAVAEAAVRAGALRYFGYPITPQNEVAEYLSKRMREVDGVFVQAESELAASNMLFGAAATGLRVFTTSSSPGISLMQEALSYIAGAQLPVVVINMARGGPGLGGILPAQSDYLQATKGGGHGDYRLLVLAPGSVQEAVELTQLAFDLAEKYRNPVMILGDGMIGQMMEPVEFGESVPPDPARNRAWALEGAAGRPPRVIKSLYLDPALLEKNNRVLAAKYEQMAREEVRYEEEALTDDVEIVVVSYGTAARICKTAIADLRAEGLRVGLLRPISLYPFPYDPLWNLAGWKSVKAFLCVEMSMGQMVEDVERAVAKEKPVRFFGRTGGIVPGPEEIAEQIRKVRESVAGPWERRRAGASGPEGGKP